MRWRVTHPGKAFSCVGTPTQAPNRRSNRRSSRNWTRPLRGRLHMYESVYASPYDFIIFLQASQIGIPFFICHPLQLTVCIHISAKTNKKITCGIHILAANRTPNRKRNRTCRRPLIKIIYLTTIIHIPCSAVTYIGNQFQISSCTSAFLLSLGKPHNCNLYAHSFLFSGIVRV
jgi:hypothetical protein